MTTQTHNLSHYDHYKLPLMHYHTTSNPVSTPPSSLQLSEIPSFYQNIYCRLGQATCFSPYLLSFFRVVPYPISKALTPPTLSNHKEKNVGNYPSVCSARYV